MALPTSGPLSMSAIATEFDQATSNMSLYTFGSTLPTPTVTSNIELANDFYGQSAATYTAFSIFGSTEEPAESAEAICGAGKPNQNTAYHSGSGTFPENGEYVYSDNDGSDTPWTEGYFRYESGEDKFSFLVDSAGEVSNVAQCEE